MIAHGADARLVGKNLRAVKDQNGFAFVDEMMRGALAEQGSIHGSLCLAQGQRLARTEAEDRLRQTVSGLGLDHRVRHLCR